MLKYSYRSRGLEVIGMIDKERIRLMTKMAKYENTKAKEDLKIVGYFKKDYASFNTWITAIWVTIGFAVILGIVVFLMPDLLLHDLTLKKLFNLCAIILIVYIFVLVTYCVYSSSFYKNKYDCAHRRVKKYYKELSLLRKSYIKEKR